MKEGMEKCQSYGNCDYTKDCWRFTGTYKRCHECYQVTLKRDGFIKDRHNPDKPKP